MKKMSKILCSVLMVCGAFSMSAIDVCAVGNTSTDETAVTTVVSTEVIESVEIPLIPENSVIEQTDSDNDEAETETVVPIITEEGKPPVIEIPKGNAVVIEDVTADVVERQFITVQSKNGNTFYLVIDKDNKGKENVYFMNLVDEYDLMAFAEDFPEGASIETPDNGEKKEPTTDSEENIVTEPEKDAESETPEKTENDGGSNNTLFILIGVLVLAGGGAFYYFRIYKNKPKAPKQSANDEDEEEYEEETVNEDNVSEEASDDEE